MSTTQSTERPSVTLARAEGRIGNGAIIGAYASIGDGASIGAYARIGDGAIIGNGAIIGAYASIGNGAIIGAYARIGDGAIIGAYARIGDGAIIGAYASIGDGASIGDRASIRNGAIITRATYLHGQSARYTWDTYQTPLGTFLRFGCETHIIGAWTPELQSELCAKHDPSAAEDLSRVVRTVRAFWNV